MGNTREYNRQYYQTHKKPAKVEIKERVTKEAPSRTEYQKKYRKENRARLDKYNLDYMRCKRWLNGSDNYSGELG